MAKENVFFSHSTRKTAYYWRTLEKEKKNTQLECVIANKFFCLSSTLELREKETDKQLRVNGKLVLI